MLPAKQAIHLPRQANGPSHRNKLRARRHLLPQPHLVNILYASSRTSRMNKKGQEGLIPQKLVWFVIAVISALVITAIVVGITRMMVQT